MPAGQQNCIRIIAGQWRGSKLNFAKVKAIRPTPDRVRETLFNWLAPDIQNAECLDLFSGSGALAFESLSRGALSVVMCDSNSVIIKTLKDNVKRLNADNAKILQCDALDFLKNNTNEFDIVFLDPPFDSNLLEQSVEILKDNNFLKPNAFIYIEADSNKELPILPQQWELHRNKKAGDVAYYLFKNS